MAHLHNPEIEIAVQRSRGQLIAPRQVSSKSVLSNQPPKHSEGAGHPPTSKLRGIAQSRMWKWLFDAHRLLGVSVEVVDDQLNVLTTPTAAGSVLRQD